MLDTHMMRETLVLRSLARQKKTVIALSVAVEAAAAVDGYHGKRLGYHGKRLQGTRDGAPAAGSRRGVGADSLDRGWGRSQLAAFRRYPCCNLTPSPSASHAPAPLARAGRVRPAADGRAGSFRVRKERCVVATTSLEIPFDHERNRGELNLQLHAHVPSHRAACCSSGSYPRIAINPVPTRSCSGISLRVPFGRGRDDAARVFRTSLIRGPQRSVHRSE
jgi:hypothetical protein